MVGEWEAEFRLSITRALADQLATTLAALVPAPLRQDNVSRVRARPGVYELFVRGERVYVGKAANSLNARLGQHLRKLSGRSGIDLADVRFVCTYVDEDLDAAAPERLLIKQYRASESVPWNTNGFGNNDPGRNRDTSVVKAAHFDAIHPIDLDHHVALGADVRTIEDVLTAAPTALPYRIRFDKRPAAKEIYHDATVNLPSQPLPVRDLAARLVAALPLGWQLTALPGYLILYTETREYESALGWWRSRSDQTVEYQPGPSRFAAGGVEADDVGSDPAEPDPGDPSP
ncbi:Eco29kI family restriction endonuclease [Micromonospora sp. HM134]|uniref:Eco29kI family restriction endonuclease n=1 Tax=Micromonospora sp. HM134 TaxID=2583243 RepID=UPI0011986A8C|nr:Eco29kI family restriction endonuclease [Micromonospora sp. HM134]QDY11140.1 Eco29kI family restriction endonuclease [Micromonospora sp. HM134]